MEWICDEGNINDTMLTKIEFDNINWLKKLWTKCCINVTLALNGLSKKVWSMTFQDENVK